MTIVGRTFFTLVFLVALMACTTVTPPAEPRTTSEPDAARTLPPLSASDYARAEQWLKPNVTKLVRNLTVEPYWIDGSEAFWYREETRDGSRFVRVDASSGEKVPAFNHQVVAGALESLGYEEVSPDNLPLSFFSYADGESAIEFELEGFSIHCALQPVTCEQEEKPLAPEGLLVAPNGRIGVRAEAGNLVAVDLLSGAETALTDSGTPHFGFGLYYGNWQADLVPMTRAGGIETFPPFGSHWAGNSRHLLTTRLDERHVAEYPFLETVPDDGSYRPILHTARIPLTGEEPPKLEWFIVDTQDGTVVRIDLPYEELIPVHQDMTAVRKHWWSDDDSRLYLLTWGDLIRSARLYEVEVASGRSREVLAEEMQPRMETNSSTYDAPNVFVIDNGDRAIWFSQRSGWGHLYLYDLKNSVLLNPITQGEWLVRDVIHVDEAGQRVFFTAGGREGGNPYYRYLYRVNFDGSDLTLLSPEPADHLIETPINDMQQTTSALSGSTLSPSGNYVVYNYSTVTEPTRSVIRRVADGSLVAEFQQADTSDLYAAGWRNPEPFVVKADDGVTDLYGLLYPPRDPGRYGRHPIIDSQYASPVTAVVPHNFKGALLGPSTMYSPASLSELGFVSVVIDARGTTYRDRAFNHHSWQNLHQIGLYDHIAAIRQLAADRDWMDIDLVGIHGGSYGGFTTLRALLEYPDFFRVGVANVPVGSFTAMYPDYHWESYHGKPEYEDGSFVRPRPNAAPQNYLNNDAELQSERLVGDLLILIGELDENVFPASTLRMVDALIRNDTNFDMYFFPNRPHHLRSPFAIRKSWDYFVERLSGRQAPDYRMQLADTVWKE